jgi:acetamidase/formamidase
MNINAKTSPATKVLKATPETVHWGYLDATIKPALTIDSGERVMIECATCNPEWMPTKESGFDILPTSPKYIEGEKGSGNHIFTGPVSCAARRSGCA